jgi:hypothetical protein
MILLFARWLRLGGLNHFPVCFKGIVVDRAFNTPLGADFIGSISAISTNLPYWSKTLFVQEMASEVAERIIEEERQQVRTESQVESGRA